MGSEEGEAEINENAEMFYFLFLPIQLGREFHIPEVRIRIGTEGGLVFTNNHSGIHCNGLRFEVFIRSIEHSKVRRLDLVGQQTNPGLKQIEEP